MRKSRGVEQEPDPKNPDPIERRLAQLPSLDLEAAASNFRGILALIEPTGLPVNYYDLTHSLIYWGTGLTDSSRRIRQQPLRDYYRA